MEEQWAEEVRERKERREANATWKKDCPLELRMHSSFSRRAKERES